MRLKKITIIINPASGKDQPILNYINDVFYKTEIDWDIKITKKFGDAERFTKEAIKEHKDLVVGYGGDGTQHELANGILTSENPLMLMAILPGGTGNGFGTGLGIPKDLKKALEIIVKSNNIKKVDAMKIGKRYGISRMYTGIDEDLQTSREDKNKYGLFAYAVTTWDVAKQKHVDYEIEIDGHIIKDKCLKCYVANSGSTGVKISIGKFDISDGLLDIFTVGTMFSVVTAGERLLRIPASEAKLNYWKGKKISIKPATPQAVWIDGEYNGKTPVTVEVIPSALNILSPE